MALDRRLREDYQRTAAEAPTTVDPDAFTSVVERVAQIRRNRRGAAVGSALAVVLVAGLVTLPHLLHVDRSVTRGASSVPSLSRSPLSETFTSSVHGYSMAYPDGWNAVAARTPDAEDVFQSGTARNVTVTSEVLPAGWTDDEWAADFLLTDGGSRKRDCFPPRAQWLPVEVGGRPGGLVGGDFGCYLTQAIVFVDHRAYIFTAIPDLPTDIFDQGLFEQMLATVTFTPASVQ
jgi:hypothetical protein